jgi:hypothetical protein
LSFNSNKGGRGYPVVMGDTLPPEIRGNAMNAHAKPSAVLIVSAVFPFLVNAISRAKQTLLALVLMALVLPLATAQTPPLATPNLPFGNAEGLVRTVVPLAAGGALIGGEFSRVNGLIRRGVARLNADGTLDTAWNANLNVGSVSAILVSGPDAYVGGLFENAGGQPRLSLARVSLADGSVSMTWQADVNGNVTALATDGTDLFVGGYFTDVAGQPRSSIARVSLATGALSGWVNDTAFNGNQGEISSLLIDGGFLYVGGSFDTIGGTSQSNLARVSLAGSNSTDAGWLPAVGGKVNAMQVFGPNLYIGGTMGTVGGFPRAGLARISTATGAAVDSGWAPNATYSFALVIDSSGVISAGAADPPVREGIAEFDLVTGATTSWDPTAGAFIPAASLAFVGADIWGGMEGSAGATSVMRWVRNDPPDSAFRAYAGTGTVDVVAVEHAPDGSVYVGGNFQGVDGKAVAQLIRVKSDGTLDTDWTPRPASFIFNGRISALKLVGSDLFAGGFFTEIAGAPVTYLAKLTTGTTATVSGTWLPNPDGPVTTLAVNGSDLYAAGFFYNLGGAARTGLAKLSTTGTGTPAAFDAGFPDTVPIFAMVATPTLLYIAGPFGDGGNGLLSRLDTTSGAADSWAPAPNNVVETLAIDATHVYAAGQFTKIGGVLQPFVAKISQATGAADPNWMPQIPNSVFGMALQSGVLFVAPADMVNGITRNATAVALSAASGLPDYEWRPTDTDFPLSVTATATSVWYGLPSSFGSRSGIAAFSTPACMGQPNGTSCGAGSCQGSVCVPSLATTTITISATPATVVIGRPITLSATVTSSGAPANGVVAFYGADGSLIGLASVVNGAGETLETATLAFSQITGVFEGSAAHQPSRSAAIGVSLLTAVPRSDMNADGRSDVIWYHTGVGGLITMNANGASLGPLYIVDHRPDLNWKVVGIGDLNGDGAADVVWRNQATGEVAGLLMNGSTVLSQGTIYTEPNLDWKTELVADVNNDGRADLVWRNSTTGEVFVMLMNGLTFTSGGVVYTEPNVNWKIVATGDLNNDGFGDLIWRNQTTGDVFGMLMNGLNPPTGGVFYSEPSANWKIVGAADYNADGRADILWQNTATGDVFLMMMNGTTVDSGNVIYNESNTAWKIVAQGDYNGDGRADILWQNSATGQVFMMLMNGFTISSGAFVYTEPDTQWKIVGP